MRIPPPSQITIDAVDIIRCLESFVFSDSPDALMSDAQAAASLRLLDLLLPDLAGVEVEIAVCARHVH